MHGRTSKATLGKPPATRTMSGVADRSEKHLGHVADALSSRSEPLEPSVREQMQVGFGVDLSRVRVHADSAASRSASVLHASAYTVGNHIVFGSGQYQAKSSRGFRLLAHEVTHIIQQSRGGAYPAPFSESAHERAAESAADAVARGARHVSVPGGTGIGVARESAFLQQNYDPSGMSDEQVQSEMALVRMFLNSAFLAGEYDVMHARRALQKLQSVWDSRHADAGGAQKYTLHLTAPGEITYDAKEISRGEAMNLLRRFRGSVETMLEVGVEGLADMKRIHEEHSIVGAISDTLAWQSMPSESEWQPAKDAVQMGDNAYTRSDVVESANAYQKASNVTRVANHHLHEYREGTIKGAGRAVTGLEVTEVAAAAVVTIGTGGTTGVLLGAGYGGLQQVAQQASEVHYGLRDKIDWAGIGFDTVVGVATGYLGGKLGNAVLGRLLRNPAVASIGRRVLSRVVSDLVAGRVGSVLHTSARALFDRLRGHENLTWGEFADRLADQLTDPKSAAFDVIMGEANRRIATRLSGGPEGAPSSSRKIADKTGGGESVAPAPRIESSTTSGEPAISGPHVDPGKSPAPIVTPAASEHTAPALPQEHAGSPTTRTPAGPPMSPKEAFGSLRSELGNEPASSKRKPGGIKQAMKDAEGFKKGNAPGQVNMGAQAHKDASDVRKTLKVLGKDYQSAHGGASSWLSKRVWRNGKLISIDYNRANAVTSLLSPKVHQSFDRLWKSFAITKRQGNATRVPAGEMMRVMHEAVAGSELNSAQQGSMMMIIDSEFRDLGLHPDDVIELPYRKAGTP